MKARKSQIVECVVCGEVLKPAPTKRWWVKKNLSSGICYDCILQLAKHVLWAMEQENVREAKEKK